MSEVERIELLVRRDGVGQTRAWVERTARLYREALAAGGHAAGRIYRPRFEQSIEQFERWLGEHPLEQSGSGDAGAAASERPSAT